MKLVDRYDGGTAPFEGDRVLRLLGIPANARIIRATALVEPVSRSTAEPFVERVRPGDRAEAWGATTAEDRGTRPWFEVDLHARRTVIGASGTGLSGATLQVDVGGGLYVDIADTGGVLTPSNPTAFNLAGDTAVLPSLTVTKVKFTKTAGAVAPTVSELRVRSIPINVSLRVGDLGPFWSHAGELGVAETTPDFAAVLQAYLATRATIEQGHYVVPITLHSEGISRLRVSLEIEHLLEEPVLPSGLNEVSLTYDHSTLPARERVANAGAPRAFEVSLPQGARVIPTASSVHVRGAFEETRIVPGRGPKGATDWRSETPRARVSSQFAHAQSIPPGPPALPTAVDVLVLAATPTALLQIDIRGDEDRKPTRSPLVAPATFRVDETVDRTPVWLSVPLPAELRLANQTRYWLVMQALEGEADWIGAPSSTESLQSTADGGLSWRNGGAFMLHHRLRYKPARFEVPIELRVGEPGVPVSLDRFRPLGRVDFTIDGTDVADVLTSAVISARDTCVEGERLTNGGFRDWLVRGGDLGPVSPVGLGTGTLPIAVAANPTGHHVHVVTRGSSTPAGAPVAQLQTVDVVCDSPSGAPVAIGVVTPAPNADRPVRLLVHPDGSRAFVIAADASAGSLEIRAVDLVGSGPSPGPVRINGVSPQLAATMTPAGDRLYLAVGDQVVVLGTSDAELDQLRVASSPSLPGFRAGESDDIVTALAMAPDGHRLFVGVRRATGDPHAVLVFATDTNSPLGAPIPVKGQPLAIAVTPDGHRVLIAHTTLAAPASALSVVDLERRTTRSFGLDGNATAVAVSPDGRRAFVAQDVAKHPALVIVDLDRLRLVPNAKLGLGTDGAIDAAITPQGDRLFVVERVAGTAATTQLRALPIGERAPADWVLTSGQVTTACLEQTSALGVLLGAAASIVPAAMSQVVAAAAGCRYDFAFWGIAAPGSDAVAELFWLGADRTLVRTDRVPVQELTASMTTPPSTGLSSDLIVPLLAHRGTFVGPQGAQQVEVRFLVAEHSAVIAGVSLLETVEMLSDGARSGSGAADGGWEVVGATGRSIVSLRERGGALVRSIGPDATVLSQRVALDGRQPLALSLDGRATGATDSAPVTAQIRWLRADGSIADDAETVPFGPNDFARHTRVATPPAGATRAEVRLTTPPGAALILDASSLRAAARVAVPVSFIADAPGNLTISSWRVAYDIAPTGKREPPPNGFAPPTPPSAAPGQGDECCMPCDDEVQAAATKPDVKSSGRFTARGTEFGTTLTRSGQRTIGFARTALLVEPSPIRVAGIGPVRELLLHRAGITSLDLLADATPEVVRSALGRGSLDYAARIIELAKDERVRLARARSSGGTP